MMVQTLVTSNREEIGMKNVSRWNVQHAIWALMPVLILSPQASAQETLVWSNIRTLPDDLISTGDAWTASRIEDVAGPSYRIAADDFALYEPIRITRIVYYAVQFNAPEVLGHDWYLYEGGSSGPPGSFIVGSSDQPLDVEDTGWINTVFETPILRNTQRPTDLVLDVGHYFLAFRSIQAPNDDGKNSILTTR